jgi:hypothetical protein
MSKVETKVIAGFPGVGKSKLIDKVTSGELRNDGLIIDSDSSHFSWLSPGVRNPAFPKNYIDHIKRNIGIVSYILVSTHKDVRDRLANENIHYTLVYPGIELKEEYIQRYRDRGSVDSFITLMDNNWDNFIEDLIFEEFPTKLQLEPDQFLSDIYTIL